MIAPPTSAPNWFCVNGGGWLDVPLLSSLRLLKNSLELKILLRRYSYPEPCQVFVPDLVLMLMTPPANLPHSGPRLLFWTLNSLIESCVGTMKGRLMWPMLRGW